MVVKIFVEEDCSLCPSAKELGDKLQGMGHKVDYCDVKDSSGLNHAIFFDVLSTPSVVVANDDNESVAKWEKEMPEMDEVLNAIGKIE